MVPASDVTNTWGKAGIDSIKYEMKSSTEVPHYIKCFYLNCAAQLEKLAEVFVVEYLIFADLPVNPLLRFPGLFGYFFGLVLFGFYPLLLSNSSHLASSDWQPKLPALGQWINYVQQDLKIVACAALHVSWLGSASSRVKALIRKYEKGEGPTIPLLLHHASARFV